MRPNFPLFQTPIDLSHAYWKKLIQPADHVIDATCGNGHDTLFLAKTILLEDQSPLSRKGKVIALDRQPIAIQNTKLRLSEHLKEDRPLNIEFYEQCHSTFPLTIAKHSIKLIVYNLGYLPCGNKKLTTDTSTTLQSLSAALSLIVPGGGISITCYPGHPEGEKEEAAVLEFCTGLGSSEWSCCYHRWVNRHKAPSLIFLQKGSL